MPIVREQIDPKIYENEIDQLHKEVDELQMEIDAAIRHADELRVQLAQAKDIIYQMIAEKYMGKF